MVVELENKLALGRLRRSSGTRIIMVLLALAVVVLIGLIIMTLLTPSTTPRSAVERDLIDSKEAVKSAPINYNNRILLGTAYAQVGDYTSAIEQFEVAAKLDKSQAQAYFNLGFTYKEMGRTKDAIAHLKKASKLKRDWTQPYNILARIYGDQKKYDKALAQTDKIIKLSPMASDVLALQGTFYEAKKDKETAISKYLEALEYDPTKNSIQAKALIRLGVLKKSKGNSAKN